MKYCPYCGADFADGAASFCMECGKSLPIAEDGQKKPKEKPVKSQKRMEKKRKHPSPKSRKKHEKPVGEHMGGAFHPKDDGYDGYALLYHRQFPLSLLASMMPSPVLRRTVPSAAPGKAAATCSDSAGLPVNPGAS